MTMVRKLEIKVPDRVTQQTESEATIALIDFNGEKFVQIDSVGSKERKLVQTLSDLRLVHLINQSTTPDRAGQR